jgi:hypothetical protein
MSLDRPLSSTDIKELVKKLKIRSYRGTFSKDKLPAQIWRDGECGIVNLQDQSAGRGTHWVCYSTLDRKTRYFDSYGDLAPPTNLRKYLPDNVEYNFDSVQDYDSVLCGQMCLFVLLHLSLGFNYTDVLDMLKI